MVLALLSVLCLMQASSADLLARHRLFRPAKKSKHAVKSANAERNVEIFVDGRSRKKIAIQHINHLDYCSLKGLIIDTSEQVVAQNGRYSKKKASKLHSTTPPSLPVLNDVFIAQERIEAQAGSFFVAAHKHGAQRIVQMTVPALAKGVDILVPYPQFFSALSTLGLCLYDSETSVVRWVNHVKKSRTELDAEKSGINPLTPVPPLPSAHSEKSPGALHSKTADSKGVPAASEAAEKTNSNVPAVEEEKEAPIRYQLPPDLKRRELDDSTDDKEHSQLILPGTKLDDGFVLPLRTSPSIASLSLALSKTPARIISIRSDVEKQRTNIHFVCDRDISDVPEAELQDDVIVLRFPGVVNATGDLSEITKLHVGKVTASVRGGAEEFRIQLLSSDREVSVEVQSDRHYVLHIEPKQHQDGTDAVKGEKPSTPRKKWDLDVIVIDAGHGGKDVGAESIHKKFEKDITLAIALKLRDEIRKKLPNTKVVMTRSTDVFVELDKRGEIANKAGGKLFISIHCNSTPTRPSTASGFETFILSPAKTATAIDVAKRENAVIKLEDKSDRYSSLNDDQLIVATLAQNSFVKLSTTFASLVQKHMKECTSMCERSVNQAGFIVLIGASMPAVLVETGFVTNSADEKKMTSQSGQLSIARGIASAVKEYAAEYAKLLAK